MKSNKVYKIRDRKTGKHLTLGHYSKRKSIWKVLPIQAIKANNLTGVDYVIDVFELVKTDELNF